MRTRDESTYKTRSQGNARYFTSRILYDDLAVVIRRFPQLDDPVTEGRPFVLVHGLGASSRYFHPVAAELAKFGTVYLVDLAGYGSAPNPRREVTIADHAGVLARHLEAAGVDDPVLVGHSMGTQVVSMLAHEHPEITDRIVLMAPTMDAAARGFWTAARRLIRDVVTCEPAAVKAVVSTDYLFRCGIPYFLKQTKQLLADRIEDRLPSLDVKALVLRGDEDCICPPEWTLRVAAMMKQATHVEVPGPHVIMYTDPPKVAAHIANHVHA